MSGSLTMFDVLTVPPTSHNQRDACRRFVHRHATDNNDAAELLAALGLEDA